MQLPLPMREVVRLESLRAHGILDTPPEQAFDDLACMAAYICGTPIALIGFMDLDRQWFKSTVGWDMSEVPREMSFCAHTILQPDVLVVSDTLQDAHRLAECPLATHGGIRFYAGVSLMSAEGYALGTLCVMDSVPRGLTEGQTDGLRKLARQVMALLELRRQAVPRTISQGGATEVPETEGIAGAALESEALCRAVTETAQDAIVVIDEDSTMLFVNRSTESTFGYSKDELLAQPLTMLMPDYLRQSHKQAVKKYVQAGERNLPWDGVELLGLRKDGKEICLEVAFGESVRDGKRVFSGICRDVTSRKKLEYDQLRLAAIVESSDDAIIGNDLDGAITSWNKGAERTYGFTAEEVIGKSVSVLTPPERSDEVAQIMEDLRRGEHVEQYDTVRTSKGGRRIDVSLTFSPTRDETGKIVGAWAVGRDITERKLAQETLRHSEQRLQGIIGSAMDAIITVNGEQIVVFNKAAEQIFRCAASEAIGCPIDRFIPARSREVQQQHMQGPGHTGATAPFMHSSGTLFAIRTDGEEFPIEATISQVEAGGEKLFTVILRDISARLHLEEQLRHAQKIDAIGQLAGGVAHEFNNFLGVILGYSELLSEEAGENESLRRKVAEIKAATQRASSLTRQLLAFSRKQVLEPQVLDLNQAIWETHKLLRRLVPANIDVVPVLAPVLGQVRVDPGQIQQILINLVVNSRDAMPEGGKVIIETADVELYEDYTSKHPDSRPGSYVMLSICDNGHGMDADTRLHIFEPFFTTKQPGKGTGLGLSTVYGIVKQSGGHIAVESAVEKGTIFRIYLPRLQGVVADVKIESSPPPEPGGNETILIVEDETALRRLLRMALERRGYTVLAAKDGAEAIEIFREHGDQVRLVVSDIMMPHVDGFELKQRLAVLRPDVKFVFMSGYSEEIFGKRQTLLQGCAFVEKPFLPDELVDKVRDLLRTEAVA